MTTTTTDYHAAVKSFQTAARILRPPMTAAHAATEVASAVLPWASALHHQGTATSRARPNDKAYQVQALKLLQEALEIRRVHLGEDHPDTLATQNSIAWAYYNSQRYRTASETFWYVFWKRQALFGPRHPAVAVAATDLARTFARLKRNEDAGNFYSIALQIYDQMNVPHSNPAVQRLRKDYASLGAIEHPKSV